MEYINMELIRKENLGYSHFMMYCIRTFPWQTEKEELSIKEDLYTILSVILDIVMINE